MTALETQLRELDREEKTLRDKIAKAQERLAVIEKMRASLSAPQKP